MGFRGGDIPIYGIYIMKFTGVGGGKEGRLPREPARARGRIENTRKKYSRDSPLGERGGGF